MLRHVKRGLLSIKEPRRDKERARFKLTRDQYTAQKHAMALKGDGMTPYLLHCLESF
jgi:hypothetical protein